MPTRNAVTNQIAEPVRHITIAAERDGQRVDNCLHALLKGVPRSLVYRLLRSGQVRVNGGRVKPGHRLHEGDVLRLPPLRRTDPGARQAAPAQLVQRMREAVVHRDRHFLVVDKPAGVAAHGGSGIDFGAIELLRAAFPEDRLELAHRLDRDTSGILVLTRSRKALVALQQRIRDRQVTKQYLALLDGCPEKGRFDVNVPLLKTGHGGERRMRVAAGGKPSLSYFRRIDLLRDASLFEVTLATGRTHQIRVHAQHVRHAIAGDEKYADHDALKRYRKRGLKRLFLHAARFEFDWQDRSYSFTAPLPQELKTVLEGLALPG